MRSPRVPDVLTDIADSLERGDLSHDGAFGADRARVAARMLRVAAADFDVVIVRRAREHRALADLLGVPSAPPEAGVTWTAAVWDNRIAELRAQLRGRLAAPGAEPGLAAAVAQVFVELTDPSFDGSPERD